MLHLGWAALDRLGNERLESSAMARELGVLVHGHLDLAAMRANNVLGGTRSSITCPALLCTGVASPRVLGAVLGTTK